MIPLRLRRLYSYLRKEKLEAFLFSSPENLLYLTGFRGGEGCAFISPHKKILFVDSRYIFQAKKEAQGFVIKEYHNKWEEVAIAINDAKCKRVSFESNYITYEDFLEFRRYLQAELVPGSNFIKNLRTIKEPEEIFLIKKAVLIAETGFQRIIPSIGIKKKEREISLMLEFYIREGGAEKIPFEIIVASGESGAYPHGNPENKEIKKGTFVIIDFGAVYQGYCSDETRTLIIGSPTLQQKKVYEAVKEALNNAISIIAPGVKFTTIDLAARKVLEKEGLGKYFCHGIGHGVGLAVHEAPTISFNSEGVAEVGMVFTIEPGVYIPGWGGVRIEEMVEVTPHGCNLLTNITKELQVI